MQSRQQSDWIALYTNGVERDVTQDSRFIHQTVQDVSAHLPHDVTLPPIASIRIPYHQKDQRVEIAQRVPTLQGTKDNKAGVLRRAGGEVLAVIREMERKTTGNS
jgi:hypothetical protein